MTVHSPESANGQLALRQQVLAIHAQAVADCLKALNCSKQDKARLLRTICQLHKEAAEG